MRHVVAHVWPQSDVMLLHDCSHSGGTPGMDDAIAPAEYAAVTNSRQASAQYQCGLRDRPD
jgi:hypothetical protein